MQLTERDDGRTVSVAAGTDVTVRLPENPTTGYRWTVEQLSGAVTVSENFAPAGAIGGAGERMFVFRPSASASGHLKLKLSRPWESAVLRRFQVQLMVR